MEKNTMQLGVDLAAEGKKGVSRRGFVGGMGAMMAAAALAAAGCTSDGGDSGSTAGSAAADADDDGSSIKVESTTGWTGTPADVLALGVSTMPLEDLNNYRQAYLDAQTEYTMEDGTVVPLPYVQMRALVHTYGQGCGNTPLDTSFYAIMQCFTEDEAQAFVDMPWGVEFTAFEMAQKTGRTVDECTEICEHCAEEGYLCAFNNNRGRGYHQVPYFQGVIEYQMTKVVESDYTSVDAATIVGDEIYSEDWGGAGTPVFYYVPCDYSVTEDGTIHTYDDIREKVLHANKLAICPCACRYTALAAAVGHENMPSFEDFMTGEYEDYMSPICDQRVETCIMVGDEAEFWLERGWGREITGEQAAAYIDRSVEDGFCMESTFGKNSETICSCHIDSCNILNGWFALGADEMAARSGFNQISHYMLEVDQDKCIACGTCVERCPLQIISINDDGWAEPGVNCVRCGQCAYVCPQSARTLVLRDEDTLAPLPQGMVEDMNLKAAWRFENGLIKVV